MNNVNNSFDDLQSNISFLRHAQNLLRVLKRDFVSEAESATDIEERPLQSLDW